MADIQTADILMRHSVARKVGMGIGTQTTPLTVETRTTYPNGTSTAQADAVWGDGAGSVAAAAFDNINLFALTELDDDGDATGRTISLAKVKTLAIRNTASAGSLLVGGGTGGGGAADAWIDAGTEGWLAADSDLLRIAAGDAVAFTFRAGVTVTNTTSHILCLAGIGSTQTYEILVTGDAV